MLNKPLLDCLIFLLHYYLLLNLYRINLITFYREGRRASDGLVAKGIFQSQSEMLVNPDIAFNSQKLHEACKAKGVMELHLLQKEVDQLKNQYQTNTTPDEINIRQIQHNRFHISPNTSSPEINPIYSSGSRESGNSYGKTGDLLFFSPNNKTDAAKLEAMRSFEDNGQKQAQTILQKPPLQQQLMQHRLLQQKRQILQKQVALENNIIRRQMLRQQSYKIAQQQQILPPLPIGDIEFEDLLAFQTIDEDPHSPNLEYPIDAPSSTTNLSPKIIKTSHIQQQHQPVQCWQTDPMRPDVIETTPNTESWSSSTLYQVHSGNEKEDC